MFSPPWWWLIIWSDLIGQEIPRNLGQEVRPPKLLGQSPRPVSQGRPLLKEQGLESLYPARTMPGTGRRLNVHGSDMGQVGFCFGHLAMNGLSLL